MWKRFLCIFIFLLVIAIRDVYADSNYVDRDSNNLVNIYLFHSDSCSHCKALINDLNGIISDYDNVYFYNYEIHDSDNKDKYDQVRDVYKVYDESVPFLVIGDKYYIGYSESKSHIMIIKTIEYYSRYGYVDRVSKIVDNDNVGTYEVNENDISLDEFIKSYGNYELFGNVDTDDMEIEGVSFITSIFTEINIFSFLGIVLVILIFNFLKKYVDKMFLLILYMFIYLVFNLIFMFYWQDIYKLIGEFCLMIILFLIFTYYYVVKKQKNNVILENCFVSDSKFGLIFIFSVSFLIAVSANYFKFMYFNKYIIIYKEIIKLSHLSIFECILQYMINMGVLFIINLFFMIFMIFVCNKFRKIIN